MHGAGNDFILVDDRTQTFPVSDNGWLVRIAKRRTGVGCEGIILIQPSDKADFRMRFFNPDGNEVEMCGNGARCAARLAYEIGAAPAKMTIETIAGVLKAKIGKNTIRLHMTAPTDYRMDQSLEIDGERMNHCFVNTGVPHVVVKLESSEALKQTDVQNIGRQIRYHDNFAPAGTNANFIAITGENSLELRTYERGVEAETPACGTGTVAAALIAARLRQVTPPVSVAVASGDVLTVDFRTTQSGAENVTLLGPAEHVFQGTLKY